jgi:hypothetical protein
MSQEKRPCGTFSNETFPTLIGKFVRLPVDTTNRFDHLNNRCSSFCFSRSEFNCCASTGTRVIALFSLLKPKLIKNNYNVLSVLACAFLNLITSIEDVEPTVSQKAMCSLETLGDASLKTVMCSLEFQFDTVISDRSIILHRLSKLYTILLRNNSTIKILSWEFFLNRFDTLSIESQISMEESGELISPQSIGGFNTESEHFIRKLNQIRFAMARTDSIKAVSSSIRFAVNRRRSQPNNDKAETDSIGSVAASDVDTTDRSTLQLLVNLLIRVINDHVHAHCSTHTHGDRENHAFTRVTMFLVHDER